MTNLEHAITGLFSSYDADFELTTADEDREMQKKLYRRVLGDFTEEDETTIEGNRRVEGNINGVVLQYIQGREADKICLDDGSIPGGRTELQITPTDNSYHIKSTLDYNPREDTSRKDAFLEKLGPNVNTRKALDRAYVKGNTSLGDLMVSIQRFIEPPGTNYT